MRSETRLIGLLGIALLASTMGALAQRPAPVSGTAKNPPAPGRLPRYVLGAGDSITILGNDIEGIGGTPIRITTSGDITLTLGVGRIHAAGMTLEELEAEITERLKVNILRPEIAINLMELRSQPVSVTGFVGSPGIVQLEGSKTLIEVLSLAGGRSTDAGNRVTITRKIGQGEIPLTSVRTEGQFYVAEVDVLAIEKGIRPQDNIPILQDDMINVHRVEVVYVWGEVRKSGAFALNDRKSISIIEALARAEGTTLTASKKNAKIIRAVPGSERIQIDINVGEILDGKAKDVMLMPEDILYIPDSYAKGAFRRTLDSLVQISTGLIIYH